MCISGWQSPPEFLHKTDCLVVGWRVVQAKVVANTGGNLGAHWSLDDPKHADVGSDE